MAFRKKNEQKQADLGSALNRIAAFLSEHHLLLAKISQAITNVFEAMCVVSFATAYEEMGYHIGAEGLANSSFKFKCNTRGDPRNFSYFTLTRGTREYELRHNLSISAARDESVLYVVDIAVIRKGHMKLSEVKRNNRTYKTHYCENAGLVTFAECKYLLAYSMLIAQFFGSVFELKPRHLHPKMFDELQRKFAGRNLFPSLLIAQGAHIGAESVIASVARRKYAILIAPDMIANPNQLLAKMPKLPVVATQLK